MIWWLGLLGFRCDGVPSVAWGIDFPDVVGLRFDLVYGPWVQNGFPCASDLLGWSFHSCLRQVFDGGAIPGRLRGTRAFFPVYGIGLA